MEIVITAESLETGGGDSFCWEKKSKKKKGKKVLSQNIYSYIFYSVRGAMGGGLTNIMSNRYFQLKIEYILHYPKSKLCEIFKFSM